MSLSHEYSEYCLSNSKGWIHTISKYDFHEEKCICIEPEDTIFKIRFVTHSTYPSSVNQYENIIFETENKEELIKAKKTYGDRPPNPYI